MLNRKPTPPPVIHVNVPAAETSPVLRRPLLRGGLYAWALLGLVGAAYLVAMAAATLAVVVVPLVLAMFPAAVLAPLVRRLIKGGWPPALATFAVMIGTFLLLGGVIAALAPSVADQLGNVGEQLRQGVDALTRFLERGPFGFSPVRLEDLINRAREQIAQIEAQQLSEGVFNALRVLTEGVAGLLFGLVALFFYLKDGPKLFRFLCSLFPDSVRDDADEVLNLSWVTIGAYIRGQLIIAVVDAILIGTAIVILRIPLALPLTLLVFVGGLFPIVGAVVAGAVAVLVALATTGVTQALILLAVIIVVQQVEGDVLAPIVLGKATELHPLATLAALTAGAVLLGVLGAFLAIPVTASVFRAASYLRRHHRERRAQEHPGLGPGVGVPTG